VAEKRKGGGKKPAHIAGPVSVEQRIWNAIKARSARRPGASFTRADIEFDTKANERTVKRYIERLVLGAYLRGENKLPKSKTCQHFTWQDYTLIRDIGLQAPRLKPDGSPVTGGVAREAMWQTVRIQKGFSALDVQLAVNAAGGKPVPLGTAKSYLQDLARAGYLKVTQPARCGMGRQLARYMLLPSMNTGPRSPMTQKSGAIYDVNLGEVVWPK
jgi:hypothetical protein